MPSVKRKSYLKVLPESHFYSFLSFLIMTIIIPYNLFKTNIFSFLRYTNFFEPKSRMKKNPFSTFILQFHGYYSKIED